MVILVVVLLGILLGVLLGVYPYVFGYLIYTLGVAIRELGMLYFYCAEKNWLPLPVATSKAYVPNMFTIMITIHYTQ